MVSLVKTLNDDDDRDEEQSIVLSNCQSSGFSNLGFTGTALMTKEEVEEQTKDVPCQVNFFGQLFLVFFHLLLYFSNIEHINHNLFAEQRRY